MDLVVSGINRGSNAGINVIYSGTVSAATEALIMGIPALAISLDTHKEADFTYAAQFARKMVRLIAGNPAINCSAINVNIPCLPAEEIKGVVVVRQGKSNIIETFKKKWTCGKTSITGFPGFRIRRRGQGYRCRRTRCRLHYDNADSI